MEGITIPNTKNKKLTLAQYADDSTTFGKNKEDYKKMRRAIAEFESASGMSVNWDKTIIMYLRAPFTLDPGDPIKVLQRGQKTRVLGVMMGHLPDKNTASIKLWENIKNKIQLQTKIYPQRNQRYYNNQLSYNRHSYIPCKFPNDNAKIYYNDADTHQ